MRTLPRICSTLLTAAMIGLGTASAVDLEGLVKNSPFGGTGAPVGPGVAPSTLEFRGMYAEGGVNYYSIYNTQTKQSSWVAEGEAPSTNVPVVVKGFDAANESLVIDNGGQPQQMALHQAVVIAYRGPSAAQLAAVSNAVAPQGVAGAPGAGGTANLTPEQVEAFRQSMRDKFSKGRGQDGGNGAANDGSQRQRGGDATNGKTPKTPTAVPATTTKTPKAPKVR
ncbi:MAG: hypothetical protein NTU71_05415 [Verrucomicrobia bacterium]|nr:hypothetical protein [Verrucomicrobiota bacterium]